MWPTKRINQVRPTSVSTTTTPGIGLDGRLPGDDDAHCWKGQCDRPTPDALLAILTIELKMTTLLAHNPMVSVRALKGG